MYGGLENFYISGISRKSNTVSGLPDIQGYPAARIDELRPSTITGSLVIEYLAGLKSGPSLFDC